MKKRTLALIAFCCTSVMAAAQEPRAPAASAVSAPDANQRLLLAMSSGAYPVTPGDNYRLTFQQGNSPSILEIQVGNDYVIQLNIFGKLNASGMKFTQVKETIEKAVVSAYPRSLPNLSLLSVGIFPVFIKGETPEARNVDAWGMSRLSEVLAGRLGPYSSIRNIHIVSADGSSRSYDLFQSQRFGDTNQDPYLRPGDTIVVAASDRTVEIAGEVKRPGKYQLLPSEKFSDLVETFGGGLTAAAEMARVRIDRLAGSRASTLYVNTGDAASISLLDGDVVTIPSKTATLPIVFVEGAVLSETPPTVAAVPPAEAAGLFTPINYNRIPYNFRQGETLKGVLTTLAKSISPMADLSGAFLVREGLAEPIPLDLAALLSGTGSAADIPLWPLDRVIIPSAQFFVAVHGDVTRPGNYPYAPSKTYRYFADLAGFADMEEIPQNVVILDSRGKRHGIGELIEPGSRIFLTAARVTVQGAVINPGNYAYRDDYTVLDYENLAGGFDPERSTNSKLTVFDSKGKPRKPGDLIQPGDRVFVESDKFEYNFGRSLPIFLSVVTAVTSVVTVYALLR
jgi:polysaccharide biosynthesis/export protein